MKKKHLVKICVNNNINLEIIATSNVKLRQIQETQRTTQMLNGPTIPAVRMHHQLPRIQYLVALGREIVNAQNRKLRMQHHKVDIPKHSLEYKKLK